MKNLLALFRNNDIAARKLILGAEHFVLRGRTRGAKLGKIQGGLQMTSQDSTKGGGVAIIFFTFYVIKISLFKVSTLSD